MKDLSRREFFKVVGSALAGAAVVVLPKSEPVRDSVEKLKHVKPYDILSTDQMNGLIDTVNILVTERE